MKKESKIYFFGMFIELYIIAIMLLLNIEINFLNLLLSLFGLIIVSIIVHLLDRMEE